jgi:hypothetical protein
VATPSSDSLLQIGVQVLPCWLQQRRVWFLEGMSLRSSGPPHNNIGCRARFHGAAGGGIRGQ